MLQGQVLTFSQPLQKQLRELKFANVRYVGRASKELLQYNENPRLGGNERYAIINKSRSDLMVEEKQHWNAKYKSHLRQTYHENSWMLNTDYRHHVMNLLCKPCGGINKTRTGMVFKTSTLDVLVFLTMNSAEKTLNRTTLTRMKICYIITEFREVLQLYFLAD